MAKRHRICLIAGADMPEGIGDARILRWDAYEQTPDESSLPRLVADDWRALRDEYLEWIGQTGTAEILAGMTVGDGPSAWWLSLMAEKSPMKSRTIYLVMKLRALEKFCAAENIQSIECRAGDRHIRKIIADWCAATERDFSETTNADGKQDEISVQGQRLRLLPHPLRGLIWMLRQYWTRGLPGWRRRGDSVPVSEIAAVTYFPNCDMEKLSDGEFRSAYWRDFHQLLARRQENPLWIWLYAPSKDIGFREALARRDHCNDNDTGPRFMLAEEVMSPVVFLGALCTYLTLVLRAPSLMRHCGERRIENSRLSLRPVLAEDWKASLRGIVAAEAAWYIALFGALSRRVRPRTGLYLFENQNWEAALVHFWRQQGVKRIIAHQHEAVKPLNLRLFENMSSEAGKPLPDRLAIGSNDAATQLINGGWPERRIARVESLRFNNPEGEKARTGGTLLLITGYLADETRLMLEIAAKASGEFTKAAVEKIVIKPHPFLPVEDMIAALDFAIAPEIATETLDQLWDGTRLVFAANSTAAIFDAMAAQVPACVCAPGDDLNLSPAVGNAGAPLVGTPEELTRLVDNQPAPGKPPAFLESPDLERWATLLDEAP